MKKAFKKILFVYKLLFFVVAPFIIVFIAPAIAMWCDNETAMWGMAITLPVGLSTMRYFWEDKLDALFEGEEQTL